MDNLAFAVASMRINDPPLDIPKDNRIYRVIGDLLQRPGPAGGEMKPDCGKDKKWFLFESNELQKFDHQKGGIMKKRMSFSPAR